MTRLTEKTALEIGKLIGNGQFTEEMGQDLLAKAGNPILTLVEDGVALGPTCGYETIARAKRVFTGGIYYHNCTAEDIDVADEQGTESRPGQVYEMDPRKCASATFEEIFTTFGAPGRAAVSQGEIIMFCKKTPHLLRRDGYGTLFLFEVKKNGESQYFVAIVYVDSGELEVYVRRFGDDYRWYAEFRHRVVAPQL